MRADSKNVLHLWLNLQLLMKMIYDKIIIIAQASIFHLFILQKWLKKHLNGLTSGLKGLEGLIQPKLLLNYFTL